MKAVVFSLDAVAYHSDFPPILTLIISGFGHFIDYSLICQLGIHSNGVQYIAQNQVFTFAEHNDQCT